jgi:hypothetical protein
MNTTAWHSGCCQTTAYVYENHAVVFKNTASNWCTMIVLWRNWLATRTYKSINEVKNVSWVNLESLSVRINFGDSVFQNLVPNIVWCIGFFDLLLGIRNKYFSKESYLFIGFFHFFNWFSFFAAAITAIWQWFIKEKKSMLIITNGSYYLEHIYWRLSIT